MKLEAVRTVARARGIKPGHLPKSELIRSIQIAEGNFACFATATRGQCDQAGCLWREDCFRSAQQQGGLS